MNIILLINIIVVFLIIFFICYLLYYKNKSKDKKTSFSLLVLASMYFILLVMLILWLFQISEISETDFLSIYSIVLFIQTIVLYYIFYNYKKNKKIIYFLLFYSLIFIVPFSEQITPLFLILFSYLLMTLLFSNLLKNQNFRKTSIIGTIYSSFSVLIVSFIFFSVENVFSLNVILNIFFLFFMFFFIKEIKDLEHIRKSKNQTKNYLIDLLRYFVFIFVLSNFIFIGTISIHELGHLGSAKILGCSSEKIVLENNLPHTEFLCHGESSKKIALLGGILFPFVVSFMFFIGGGTFIKEIALLVTGINLIISYKDFSDLGITQNIAISLSLIGGLIIIFAIAMLAKSRTEEKLESYIKY